MAQDLNLLVRAELDKRQSIQSINRMLQELTESRSLKKLQVRLELGQTQLLALVTDQTRVLYSALAGISGQLGGTLASMGEIGVAMSAANYRIGEVAQSIEALAGQWRALAAAISEASTASAGAGKAAEQAAPDTKPLLEWREVVNQVFNDVGAHRMVADVMIDKIKTMAAGISALSWITSIASASTTGLKLAMIALQSVLSFGIAAAVTAVISGLYQLVGMIGAAKEKQQEYLKSLSEQTIAEQKRIDQLTELKSKYDDLNLSQEELRATQEKMAKLMPEAISHYDEQGNAIYKSKQEIDKLIESEQKLLALKKQALSNSVSLSMEDSAKQIDQARRNLAARGEKEKQAEADLKAVEFARQYNKETGYNSLSRVSDEFQTHHKVLTDKIRDIYEASGLKRNKRLTDNLYLPDLDAYAEQLTKKLGAIQAEVTIEQDKLEQGIQAFMSSFQLINEDVLRSADVKDANVSLFLERFAASFLDTKELTKSNFQEMIGLFRSYSKELVDVLQENKVDLGELVETGRLKELEKLLKESGIPAEAAALSYQAFAGSLAGASKESERMADAKKMLEGNLNQLVQQTVSDVQLLDQAMAQLSRGQGLSTDTIMKLTEQYPQLQLQVGATTDILKLQQNELKNVRQKVIEKAQNDLIQEGKSTAATYQNIFSRLQMYGIEVEALDKLQSRKAVIAELEGKKLPTFNINEGTDGWGDSKGLFASVVNSGKKRYNQFAEQYNSNISQLQTGVEEVGAVFDNYQKRLNAALNQSGSGGGSQTSRVSAGYTPPKMKEPPYEPGIRFSRLEEEIKQYNRLLEDNRSRIEDAIARGKPYSSLLENRIKLYQELAGSMKELEQVQLKEQQELAGKLTKLGLIDGSGQVIDGLSERLVELSKGKEKDRMNLSMDAIEQMVTDFTALKDKVAQTKQELNGLVTELAQALEGSLERIRDAGTGKRDAIRRKISLMGEVNTEEELTALAGYTERIVASLKSDSARIWSEISRLRGIVNDASATPEMRKAAELALTAYSEEANQLQAELVETSEELGKQQAESIVKGFDKQLEAAEFELSLLGDSEEDLRKAELMQEQLRRQTVAAREKLNAQLVELERKLGSELDQAERMRTQTKLEGLQRYDQQLAKSLADMARREQSRQQEALKAREAAAEEIIASYKKMLEKQRQLQLDAIKAERDSENKRYTERMQHLDEEMGKFEESIQMQLRSLDRLNEAEDSEEALAKLLKERGEIESRLNVLALDDSWESKAKQKELREQLEHKQEEISKFQRDRERAEQKQALQDQLDDRKKTIDEAKRLEGKFHDAQLTALDQRQQAIERAFEAQLGDERHFYEMKQQLMSDDASKVQTQLATIRASYETFFQQVLDSSKLYGSQIADNILYAFQQDLKPVESYQTNHGTEVGAGSEKTAEAWKQYLANKQEAETKGTTAQRLKELKGENDRLRAEFKFRDGSFTDLSKLPGPVFTAQTGGVTPSFAGGKFLLAHEKEMVLNKQDTQHVLEAIEISRQLTAPLRQSVAGMLPAATGAATVAAAAASAKSALGTVIERLYIDVSGKFAQPTGEDVGASIIQSLRRKGITFA